MKKRYKVLIIIGSVIAVLTLAGIIAVPIMEKNLEKALAADIEDIDLSAVADGTYTGSGGSFPVMAKVNVTVKDHVITDVEIDSHYYGPGHGAEAITGEVVKAQSLKVDAVSGATKSSKVMLLAIEDALKKGKG